MENSSNETLPVVWSLVSQSNRYPLEATEEGRGHRIQELVGDVKEGF